MCLLTRMNESYRSIGFAMIHPAASCARGGRPESCRSMSVFRINMGKKLCRCVHVCMPCINASSPIICICSCGCACACVCACVRESAYVRACVCVRVWVFVGVYMCTRVCVYMCTCTCARTLVCRARECVTDRARDFTHTDEARHSDEHEACHAYE